MDKIKAFFEAMTFFNWLTLIAFLFAAISVLNALLSLKSRFRDWRGIQNIKGFEKRVRQLERELRRIKEFADNPSSFHWHLLDMGTRLCGGTLVAIGMFITAFAIYVTPFGGTTGIEIILSLLALTILGMTVGSLVELNRLIRVVYDPDYFAVKIIRFIVDGSYKGLKLDADSELMNFLREVKSGALRDSLSMEDLRTLGIEAD